MKKGARGLKNKTDLPAGEVGAADKVSLAAVKYSILKKAKSRTHKRFNAVSFWKKNPCLR
jgi:hypothetical protein